MKNGIFLLSTILIMINTSCHKKKTIKPIDAAVKKYFSYKPGTYWVYRDSLTGKVDSFVVIRNSTVVSYNNDDDNFYTEMAETYSYSGNVIDSAWIRYYIYKNKIDFSYSNYYYSVVYSPLFTYPFPEEGIHSDQYGTFIVENISSININTRSYYNLIKLTRKNNTFYINNDGGLIKFSINEDTMKFSLELLNYYILH